ncbi:hypothetical protein ACFQV2_20010 [Actinokineospora soli]|uniref:Uncharacterized protein n=1 Tax=Actinokineospora soli TaxID=1048753 RepID=A0ABW2TNR9_9PSEU
MNTATIVQKTLRVPRREAPPGDAAAVALQFDAVLATAGFKAASDLLEHVSAMEPGAAIDLAVEVLEAVSAMVGDHVTHNPYFRTFPRGVPDTVEFWLSCLRDALIPMGHSGSALADEQLLAALGSGWIGLLALPTYGRPQHTFAELLAAHAELIPAVKDRVTVLHLGADLATETRSLYLALAGSTTPLGEDDLTLLARLAEACPEVEPAAIPVRENRSVVNAARVAAGQPLLGIDTVVDVLRLACQVSGGDPTLRTPTRFRALRRRERRALMAALDQVVADNEGKLGDVARHAGPFKRLGERLHPHEYPRHPHAQEVFAVARGERTVHGPAGRAELAFAAGTSRPRRRPWRSPPACWCVPWTGSCAPAPRPTPAPPCSTPPPRPSGRCPGGSCARCASTWPTARRRSAPGSSPPAPAAPGSPPTPARPCPSTSSRGSAT